VSIPADTYTRPTPRCGRSPFLEQFAKTYTFWKAMTGRQQADGPRNNRQALIGANISSLIVLRLGSKAERYALSVAVYTRSKSPNLAHAGRWMPLPDCGHRRALSLSRTTLRRARSRWLPPLWSRTSILLTWI